MSAAPTSRTRLVRTFDRATLLGITLGLLLMLQPWWPAGFRLGFFTTLAFALLQILASHLPQDAEA